MEWQRQNSDTVWTVRFLERLEALEGRGFTVPITKKVRALAEEDMERTHGHKLPK
jgi:hypothetical protein